MSTYATPADIREAVAPDGNLIGTCAELSDEQLQRAIQRGQDLVDATTGVTFTDNNAPSLLVGLVIALASYYATLAYRKGKELGQYHPVVLQYQDARMTLTQIKQNLIDVTPGPDNDQPAVRTAPLVINPQGLQGATMFTLEETGLEVRTGEAGPPTIDPALTAWGVI